MKSDLQERLAFLQRVVGKEVRHLRFSSGRVFAQPFDVTRAESLAADEAQAERVEACRSPIYRWSDISAIGGEHGDWRRPRRLNQHRHR